MLMRSMPLSGASSLPKTPIGVFWDIENCPIPKRRSPLDIVPRIRTQFFQDHQEYEFMCVCDISKERRGIIQALNLAQVNVVHINATSKNAADDKLRQAIHKFADTVAPPATVMLISSDQNFAPILSDLRYRKNFHIILLHQRHVHEALILCAHESYIYEDLLLGLPSRNVSEWHVGDTCRAIYSADGLLYSAIILSINGDEKTCFVRYVRYNNEEQHNLRDLLPVSMKKSRHLSDLEGKSLPLNNCRSISCPPPVPHNRTQQRFNQQQQQQGSHTTSQSPPWSCTRQSSRAASQSPMSRQQKRQRCKESVVQQDKLENVNEAVNNKRTTVEKLTVDMAALKKIKKAEQKDLMRLEVRGLPLDKDENHIVKRLNLLASNCGGKAFIVRPGIAKVTCRTQNNLKRAQKRMDGESVFGCKIQVDFAAAVPTPLASISSQPPAKQAPGKKCNTNQKASKASKSMTDTNSQPASKVSSKDSCNNRNLEKKTEQTKPLNIGKPIVKAGMQNSSSPYPPPLLEEPGKPALVQNLRHENGWRWMSARGGGGGGYNYRGSSASPLRQQNNPEFIQNDFSNRPMYTRNRSSHDYANDQVPATSRGGHGSVYNNNNDYQDSVLRNNSAYSDPSHGDLRNRSCPSPGAYPGSYSEFSNRAGSSHRAYPGSDPAERSNRRSNPGAYPSNSYSDLSNRSSSPGAYPGNGFADQSNRRGPSPGAYPGNVFADVGNRGAASPGPYPGNCYSELSNRCGPSPGSYPGNSYSDLGNRGAASHGTFQGSSHGDISNRVGTSHRGGCTAGSYNPDTDGNMVDRVCVNNNGPNASLISKYYINRPKSKSPIDSDLYNCGNESACPKSPIPIRKQTEHLDASFCDLDDLGLDTTIDPDASSGLRDIINQFSQKPSREVLMLQQQLYQEEQPPVKWDSNLGNGYHGYQTALDTMNTHGGRLGHQYQCGNGNGSTYMNNLNRSGRFSAGYPWRSPPRGTSPCYLTRSMTPPCDYPMYSLGQYGTFMNQVSSSYHDMARFRPSSPYSGRPCSPPSPGFMPLGDIWLNAVELTVSNLDYNISAKEWRKILYSTFSPQVQILNIYVKTQPDNTSLALLKVPSIEEARFTISQFHRKKIGYKRIHVALRSEFTQETVNTIKAEAVSLLVEVTGHVLPLFKFIELFDKRYHRPISVSELYKMKDTIEIREQGGAGRMVYLIDHARSTSVSPEPDCMDKEIQEILEIPVCLKHCPEGSPQYIEALNCNMLPKVSMRIRVLSVQVHTLIESHAGSIPLMSFIACYEAELHPLELVEEGGVPLEHLISCVPGVEIIFTKTGVRKVQWLENKPPESQDLTRRPSSPLLSQQLTQISREIIDLLKHSPQCRMPVSKFIPSYHHHFGRQCRVADYGYTKLFELFDAIPHVLQIMGNGDRRFLALSHKAQIRRFTADLLKLLKAQPFKQIAVSQFLSGYEKVFERPLDITDYGVCHLEDMLAELPPSVVLIEEEERETMLTIPRRDQTSEEIGRTKQFALEVVDLLKHNPQCRMPFNKFIPAYHHHFGHQCRVADYGFTKLLELFEAIPHVVQLEDEGEERLVSLTEPELRKVLAEQLEGLLRMHAGASIPIHEFLHAFSCQYGFPIRLQDYKVTTVTGLLEKFKHIIRIERDQGVDNVVLCRHRVIPELAHQILLLLMNQSGGSLPLMELCSRYKTAYFKDCDVKKIREELLDYVQVTGDDESAIISLTQLQVFARDVRNLIHACGGRIFMQHFENAFKEHFGVEIKPALYGFPTITSLLSAIPHVLIIRGKGMRRSVVLTNEYQSSLTPALMGQPCRSPPVNHTEGQRHGHTQSPDSHVLEHSKDDKDLIRLQRSKTPSPIDLLAVPLPPTLPSPTLLPAQIPDKDLIRLESPTESHEDDILGSLTDDEKHGQKTPLCQTPTSELLRFAAQCLPVAPRKTPSPVLAPCGPSTINLSRNKQSERRNTHTSVAELQAMLDKVRQGKPSIGVSMRPIPIRHSQNKKEVKQVSAAKRPSPAMTVPAVNKPKSGKELMELFSGSGGGWWKVSTEQLEQVPMLRERMDNKTHVSVNKTDQNTVAQKTSTSVAGNKPDTPNSSSSTTQSVASDANLSSLCNANNGELLTHSLPTSSSASVKPPPLSLNSVFTVQRELPGKTSISKVSMDKSFHGEPGPVDTSSIKSDSSPLSGTPMSSPKKSPRKLRIAAKFSNPIEPRDNLGKSFEER